MAAKLPKLDHVKYVRRRGKVYAYFNTGRKKDDKPIYSRLPDPAGPSFYQSYASFKAARDRRAAPSYTVTALADDFAASKTFADLAASSRKNYGFQLAKIKAEWGKFEVDRLEAYFVRKVIEAGRWPAATANMVVAVIGAMYRWGRQNDKATIDPVRDISMQDMGEHEPWPEDVVEAALASENDLVRLGTHLLYFTGQRIGDVCKMRWGDIRDGYIFVRQTKTKKVVEPPLTAELAAELERTPKTGLCILTVTPETLRAALKKFTAGLGVETVPHGLRKNAVNALLEAGCTIAETAAITGQTHQTVEHYAAQVNRRKLGQSAVVKFDQARRNRGRT